MTINISRPGIALIVTFGVAVILFKYGIVNGSLFLFDFFAGVAIYKIFTYRS